MKPKQDWLRTPIFILNFNQISYMRQLVEWLRGAGYQDITILDNHSTYAPLLQYYDELQGDIRVVRRAINEHKSKVWTDHLEPLDRPFVLTTSDIVPDPCCPQDVVERLASLLAENPHLFKAGMGLRIDNLPDHYMHKDQVLIKQSEYWRKPALCGAFCADIDFTFSLYRCGSPFSVGPAVRTSWPYVGRHEPWYSDSGNRTEEEIFYENTIEPGRGSWGRTQLPEWLVGACLKLAAEPPPTLVHLMSGTAPFPGWINIDHRGNIGAQVTFDLENCPSRPLPFKDNSIDGFFIGHAFHSIKNKRGVVRAMLRVARDGARFVIRVPQPRKYQSRASPYRIESIKGWIEHPNVRLAESMRARWRLNRIKLVAIDDPGSPEDNDVINRMGTDNDIVREIVVHLVAEKERRCNGAGAEPTAIEVNTSPFDEHAVF